MVASAVYMFVEQIAIKYFLLFCIKFGIALTFILIYCFTTELYPTQIRGLAFGLANTFGRLATLVASSIVTVDDRVFLLMNIVECLIIIALTFFLPETKGVHLTDKIAEQNLIEKN